MNTTTPDEATDVRAAAEAMLVGGGSSEQWQWCQSIARAFLSQRAELARLRAANAGLVKDLETIERERTDWKLCTDGNVARLQSMIRAALARHAATNLAAPPLVWSDAKPTVPGWYWRRDDINQEPCIGYYDPKNWFGTEWMRDLPGQFAGPIPPPAPTPTEDAPR